MLSPPAIPLVVRHLDSVDDFLSKRLVGVRPWLEPGLTSLLCDLLDDRTQPEYALGYSSAQLRLELLAVEPLTRMRCIIETHEYPPNIERYVTQADLGLVIRYENALDASLSREEAWLLQAKRLYPASSGSYSVSSAFRAADSDQAARIKALNATVGVDFVRYLLYCPRPQALSDPLSGLLAQYRLRALDGEIFDFAFGLAIRDELLAGGPSLAAGMFITGSEVGLPSDFGEVHKKLLHGTTPFAWFVLRALLPQGRRHMWRDEDDPDLGSHGHESGAHLRSSVARGEVGAIAALTEQLDVGDSDFRFLPAHTLQISLSVGDDELEAEQADIQ